MSNMRTLAIMIGLVFVIFLSACAPRATVPLTATPEATRVVETVTPQPSPSPTLPVQQTLTICLGEEPASLYLYGNLSASARSVLAAIYDGPIDTYSFDYQAVILQKLPRLEDGDALVSAVSVKAGDAVVDADGQPVTLQAGVRLRPSGCVADDCIITYDGSSETQMDQMVVNFSLLDGLTWSDGEPLTADDSVYSFELASSPETAGSKFLINHTQAYEAVDALTVQWWGKPGYMDPGYVTNFWTPTPRHAWGSFTPAELPGVDPAGRNPIGWGPYIIEEWLSGDGIYLKKNPNYFRAGEGLPAFDKIIFRFVADPNLAISQLIAGTCDVLDPSIPLDNQVELLQAFTVNQQLSSKFSTSLNLEQLDLGVEPAAYDDGFNLAAGDRPDLLGDKRTRQAIAMCLDRQKVVDEVLLGLSEVPSSFIPGAHPLFDETVMHYPFDVQAGIRLLDEMGWKDKDNDPTTPRQAWKIPGIPDGTELRLNYVTTGALQRRQVSEILSGSLAECGIQVDLQYLDPLDLYQIGQETPLFGRKFELAELALSSTGFEPACQWYASTEIPGAANNWMGVNFSGYENPVYDAACQAARSNLGQEVSLDILYADVQKIFSEDLPVIPLYWQVKVAAARVGLCGFWLDPTATNALWNIEGFALKTSCPDE
jgi:peptide/nickel transport system substrate-binding protein